MLEVIEDVNFARDSLSGDNLVHLWHVASPVDLTLVIDLELNLNSLIFWQVSAALSRSCLASLLSSLGASFVTSCWSSVGVVETFTVLPSVLRRLQRDLHFDYLHVVLLVIGGMSTDKESLHGPVTVEWSIAKMAEGVMLNASFL